jgi:hypothetical protein
MLPWIVIAYALSAKLSRDGVPSITVGCGGSGVSAACTAAATTVSTPNASVAHRSLLEPLDLLVLERLFVFGQGAKSILGREKESVPPLLDLGDRQPMFPRRRLGRRPPFHAA